MAINVKSWVWFGIASLLLGGCSGSVDGGGSGGTGGNGAGGNGAGGMGTGGTGGNGSGGSGSGSVCGGFSGMLCGATEYCDYPNDMCGATDGQGVCRLRPEGCDLNYAPVCACDGMVYSNDCAAATAGVDISTISSCPPPMVTQFQCGHIFCDTMTQYCHKTTADVFNTPDSYSCVALPNSCTGLAPSCDCIGDVCGAPIPGACEPSGGGFKVTCPGG